MKHTIYFPKCSSSLAGYLFCIPLFIGMLAGSVWYSGHSGHISPFLHQYFSPRLSGETVSEVFISTLMMGLFFTAIAFLSGLSAIGQPVAFIQPLYRGFGIGLSAAVEYSADGAGALPEILLLLLPKALIASVISFIAVREALRSSCVLMKAIAKAEVPERPVLRLYCLRFGVLSAFCIIAAAVDAILSYLISGNI